MNFSLIIKSGYFVPLVVRAERGIIVPGVLCGAYESDDPSLPECQFAYSMSFIYEGDDADEIFMADRTTCLFLLSTGGRVLACQMSSFPVFRLLFPDLIKCIEFLDTFRNRLYLYRTCACGIEYSHISKINGRIEECIMCFDSYKPAIVREPAQVLIPRMQTTCPVCLETISDEQPMFVFDCGHCVHGDDGDGSSGSGCIPPARYAWDIHVRDWGDVAYAKIIACPLCRLKMFVAIPQHFPIDLTHRRLMRDVTEREGGPPAPEDEEAPSATDLLTYDHLVSIFGTEGYPQRIYPE